MKPSCILRASQKCRATVFWTQTPRRSILQTNLQPLDAVSISYHSQFPRKACWLSAHYAAQTLADNLKHRLPTWSTHLSTTGLAVCHFAILGADAAMARPEEVNRGHDDNGDHQREAERVEADLNADHVATV
jgi:hypothetical protein